MSLHFVDLRDAIVRLVIVRVGCLPFSVDRERFRQPAASLIEHTELILVGNIFRFEGDRRFKMSFRLLKVFRALCFIGDPVAFVGFAQRESRERAGVFRSGANCLSEVLLRSGRVAERIVELPDVQVSAEVGWIDLQQGVVGGDRIADTRHLLIEQRDIEQGC